MNEIIKEELKKCKVAKIPPYTDDTKTIYISKVNKIDYSMMLPNHFYLIKIKDSIMTNKTIAYNWNNGWLPKHHYYKVEKLLEYGNMTKLNGIAFDYSNNLDLLSEGIYGFLPSDGFEVLEEV